MNRSVRDQQGVYYIYVYILELRCPMLNSSPSAIFYYGVNVIYGLISGGATISISYPTSHFSFILFHLSVVISYVPTVRTLSKQKEHLSPLNWQQEGSY